MTKATDPKTIIKLLRAKDKEAVKANITYRLTKDVAERFKASCDTQEVVPSHVLEEFMKAFIAASKS